MKSSISVVDFFSGCGGTSAGLRDAGMDVRVGIDFDPQASQTFRVNFPGADFIEMDVRRLDVETVRQALPRGPVLFAGCAPCQPFSKQNRQKRTNDTRRSLLSEFGRFVTSIEPDFVIVENVPGLQNVGPDGPFPEFQERLMDAGYSVEAQVMRAGDFGVPQERRRLVLVASRHGAVRMPTPRPAQQPTVRDSIGTLPALAAGERDAVDPDHQAMKLSSLNLQRIRATSEGGGRHEWPDDLLANCHRNHAGHSDTYGRMAWDRPASGLTTRCLSYSNGRFGHPDQDRAISAREAALLQTFPSNFRFEGSLVSKGVQIGNAVPPAMAAQIGRALTSA